MTSREALLKGGENGAALDLEAPEKSALLDALAPGADPHMPPKKQLAAGADRRAETLGARKAPPGTRPRSSTSPRPRGRSRSRRCRRRIIPCWPSRFRRTRSDSRSAAETRSWSMISASPFPRKPRGRACMPIPSNRSPGAPDHTHLVTGAFRRVVIWNAESLAPERTITEGLTDRVAALRFLPNGKQFVIADGRVAESGTVRIAELETGALTASWPAHSDTIFDLAVSSDGKLLATAGGDKLVKLWDLETHQEIAKLEGHIGASAGARLRPGERATRHRRRRSAAQGVGREDARKDQHARHADGGDHRRSRGRRPGRRSSPPPTPARCCATRISRTTRARRAANRPRSASSKAPGPRSSAWRRRRTANGSSRARRTGASSPGTRTRKSRPASR